MAQVVQPSETTAVPAGVCPPLPTEPASPSLFQNGELTFQAHHVGWIVASFFTIVATSVSIWLICKHLAWYTNPRQQRQIVRLLLMVPIYSIISCLAYFFWNHAITLSLIRDAYEGIILASFFYLLLEYLAPTAPEQKEFFRNYKLDKWAWPLGKIKRKPDGLLFLQSMKWCILQYCWVRPLTTLCAIFLNLADLYCEQSWSPRFGSIWILVIVSLSVTVALYCLIQFYLAISEKIKRHRPLLQLFSIKAIIALMFWQSSALSGLAAANFIKDNKYMSAKDINVGIAALLQTFEMVIFAFLHVKCFSYIPYRKTAREEQTLKGPAFAHAMDFRDFWRETRDGVAYMWRTVRGKEAEFEARRRTHFERAMGKSRTLPGMAKDLPPEPHPEENDISDGDESPSFSSDEKRHGRQEKSAFGKKAHKSQGLEIGHVAKSRLLPSHVDEEMGLPGHDRQQRSWWARMYGRLSGDDQVHDLDPTSDLVHSRQSGAKPVNVALPLKSGKSRIRDYANRRIDLEESPPPSLLGKSRHRHKSEDAGDLDGLPSEKRPFLDWNPSITQPPRLPEENSESKPNLPTHVAQSEVGETVITHSKEDSVLGRLFARSSEHSRHETGHGHEDQPLPSIFQRGKDIISVVKGWNAHEPKPLPPMPSLSSPPKEGAELISKGPDAKDIEPELPMIPSPTPSPPGTSRVPLSQPLIPLQPVQPTPILHQSLSYARRPSLLIADEAGTLPPLEKAPTSGNSEIRTSKWVATTHKYIEKSALPEIPGPVPGPVSARLAEVGPSQSRRHNHQQGSSTMPNSGSQRYRDFPLKGPRPTKLVMPMPLSPARFPGSGGNDGDRLHSLSGAATRAVPNPPPDQHQLPLGAGYGQIPANGSGLAMRDSKSWIKPSQVVSKYSPYANLSVDPGMVPHIEPYQLYTQNWAAIPPPPVQPRPQETRFGHQGHVTSQPTRVERGVQRARSPFGIQAPSSDSESLPKHPGLRQQTARRRRESQPPPSSRAGPSQAAKGKRPSRRLSEPPQNSYNGDVSSSPAMSAANLLSSPSSPKSPHGDSRYPRPTPRAGYFDAYDSRNPYLTSIMDDGIAPVIIAPPNVPSSSARRIKRR